MKNTLKKIAAIGTGLLLGASAMAQSGAAPIPRFLPLLSGYNVLVTTNGAVTLGTTNTLFTAYNGQVLYSLTNNMINGTVNTNASAADAFQTVALLPDANGDINANAAIWVAVGYTNWIPVVVTNSVGQYFVTNNWILGESSTPNWMYPATTNYYPSFGASATNVVTVTLYRAGTKNPKGGISGSINNGSFPMLAETTSAFNIVLTANGTTGVCVTSNLPAAWLQGAKHVYASVNIATNNAGANNLGIIVNQIGILQPQ